MESSLSAKLGKTHTKNTSNMTNNTSNKLLLIDGDMIIYKAACAAEEEIRWDDETWTLQTNMNDAKEIVETQIKSIIKALNSSLIKVFFSPSRTFRHNLWPAYKSNRKDKRKPLGLRELREWVSEKYDAVCYENIEADDAIGIWVTEDPENRIAVSGDKDFGTLPCTWYNHLNEELKTTNEKDANHFHLVQSLTGDTTDGFSGLKGIGPATAEKILKKGGDLWQTVVDAYKSKGSTEEEALLTARLARILRSGDYDFSNNTVTLWNP